MKVRVGVGVREGLRKAVAVTVRDLGLGVQVCDRV